MTFAWVLVVVLWAFAAVAQSDAPPADSVTVPLEVAIGAGMSLVVAFAAFLAAVIPAKKMPKALRMILDLIAQNWGHARNAEGPR